MNFTDSQQRGWKVLLKLQDVRKSYKFCSSFLIFGFDCKIANVKCSLFIIYEKIVNEMFFMKSNNDLRLCICGIQSLSHFPSSLRAIILTKDSSFRMIKCVIIF
jgi:hypothetical protein